MTTLSWLFVPPTRSYIGVRGAIYCNGSEQLDLATFVMPRKGRLIAAPLWPVARRLTADG